MARKKIRKSRRRRDGVVQRYWYALGRLVKNPDISKEENEHEMLKKLTSMLLEDVDPVKIGPEMKEALRNKFGIKRVDDVKREEGVHEGKKGIFTIVEGKSEKGFPVTTGFFKEARPVEKIGEQAKSSLPAPEALKFLDVPLHSKTIGEADPEEIKRKTGEVLRKLKMEK